LLTCGSLVVYSYHASLCVKFASSLSLSLVLSSMTNWTCCLTTDMTMRIAILRDARRKLGSVLGFNRLIHSVPQSPPLAGSIDHGIQSVQPVLPEFSSPSFSFGGSMELMAVPKRKVRYLQNFSFILDFLFLARHYRL
jgi:hypothetical protein